MTNRQKDRNKLITITLSYRRALIIYKFCRKVKKILFPRIEQNSFFIFLSSEDSLSFHQDNVAINCNIELKERIQLFGECEVGIGDFDCMACLSQKCYAHRYCRLQLHLKFFRTSIMYFNATIQSFLLYFFKNILFQY